MSEEENTPAATGEAFEMGEIPPELEEPSAEAQTGEEAPAGEVAAPDTGQTAETEEEEEIPDKFKDADGKLDKAKVLKAYKESESSRSKLDLKRVELEAERNATRPVIEKANAIIDRQTQPQEKEVPFEERRDKFLQDLAEDPFKAMKELMGSPEVKETFKKSVDEAQKPYQEARMQETLDKMLLEATTEITTENGYPVNFADVREKIGKILEQRPWLRRDPECLTIGYETLLRQEPELLKNWNPSSKKSPKKPPVTETGAPSSSKTSTPKDPDAELIQEIMDSDKLKEKEGTIFF